jgi:hypothetical protein
MVKPYRIVFSVVLAAAAFAQTAPQTPPENKSQQPAKSNSTIAFTPAVPKTPEGIANFLVPDNVAFPARLSQVPKADAISALTKEQPKAAGQRGDSIAFLLVLLGENADVNRQRLFDSLRDCRTDPDNCNEQVVSYLGDLYRRGDILVIDPMLDAVPNADSVVAEELGSTLEDMVAANARPLITGLSRRTPAQQREVCHLIAAGDGGGMPEDTAADVNDALEKLAREVGPVSTAAMTCLNEVRAFVPGK